MVNRRTLGFLASIFVRQIRFEASQIYIGVADPCHYVNTSSCVALNENSSDLTSPALGAITSQETYTE